MFDSEEAVVTGKLINLRYYVLHLLSNCFHLSTYIRREELLKFNISIMRLIKNGPIIQLILRAAPNICATITMGRPRIPWLPWQQCNAILPSLHDYTELTK